MVLLVALEFSPRRGPDEFQLIAVRLGEGVAGLGADADPVDAARHRKSAVGLDRNREALGMQRVEQRRVELQHRLAAGQQDRKSVVSGKSVRVCVDVGGGRSIKKQYKEET